jgi:hypothetical protein
MTLSADGVKACCAAAYASPAARWLLGDSFHPGGAALTAELGRALGVGSGSLAVDVASGPGTSAVQVARETGCRVVGVDLSPESVAAAGRATAAAGLAGRVRFVCGDAEALPLPDTSADGVLCECALCTFPDKAAATREMARVLRRGGRLALSDVTAEPDRLPPELATLTAWTACLGGALPLREIARQLGEAGLEIERSQPVDGVLAELVERVDARLRAARIAGDALPDGLRGALDRALELVAVAREAVAGGVLGYGVVVARRP